jgi:hypothetical protein
MTSGLRWLSGVDHNLGLGNSPIPPACAVSPEWLAGIRLVVVVNPQRGTEGIADSREDTETWTSHRKACTKALGSQHCSERWLEVTRIEY